MLRSSHNRSLLQACAFALLLLGLLCEPILDFVGELHAVEHAALASHVGDHGDDHGNNGEEEGHAVGGHGLMHQYSGGAGSIPPVHPVIAMGLIPSATLPAVEASPPIGSILTLPFRPPIA